MSLLAEASARGRRRPLAGGCGDHRSPSSRPAHTHFGGRPLVLVGVVALLASACRGPGGTTAGSAGSAPGPAGSASLPDTVLSAPVAAPQTLYVLNGYHDIPQGQTFCPSPGTDLLDHCGNQLDAFDLVPSDLTDTRILAPLPGAVVWEDGGCLGMKTSDYLNLTICHFANGGIRVPIAPGKVLARGTVLGLRDPSRPWIHLNLDVRYTPDGMPLPSPVPPATYAAVPFDGDHAIEGLDFPAASPPTYQQYRCETITSNNHPTGDTREPSPAPSVTPIWSNWCTTAAAPVAPSSSVLSPSLGLASPTGEPGSAQMPFPSPSATPRPAPTPTHTPTPTPKPTATPTQTPTATATPAASFETVVVPSSVQWIDTGFAVSVGGRIGISASGSWTPGPPESGSVGPDGSATLWGDNFLDLVDIGVCASCAGTVTPHWGALIGYIGSDPPPAGSYAGSTQWLPEAQRVFFVGSDLSMTSSLTGELWLAFNDDAYSGFTSDNTGQVTAHVAVATP